MKKLVAFAAVVCLVAAAGQASATLYDLWDWASWGGRSNGYQGPVMNQFTQGGYNGNPATGAFVQLQAAAWGEVFCWPGQTGTGYGGYTMKWLDPTQDSQAHPGRGWRQQNEVRQIEASNALAGEQWIVHRWTAPSTGIATIHMGAYGRNNWNLSGVNVVIAKNRVAIKSGWFEGFDGSPMMNKDVRANGGDAVDCHVVYDDTIGVVAGDTLDIATNGDGRSFYPDATIEFTVDLVPGEFISGVVTNSASTPWPGTPIEGATVEVDGGTATATTRADGSYYLILGPDTYTIRVSKAGYADVTFPVTLAAGEASVGNDIGLSLATGAIAGTVTSVSSGDPIGAATVKAIGSGAPAAMTQADGRYLLLVPAGSYTVEADKFGYSSQQSPVSVSAGATSTLDFQLSDDASEPMFFYYSLWDLKSWGGRSSGYQGAVMNQFTQGGYDGDSATGTFLELEPAGWGEVFCWPDQSTSGAGGYVRKAYREPSYDQAGGGYTGWRQENELRQLEASNALAGEQWLVHRWTAPVPGTATVHMGAYGRNNWNLSGVNAVIAKNRVAIKSGWFEGFDGSPMMSKDVRASGGDAVDCHLVYDDTISVAAGDVLDIATNGDGREFYPDATIEFSVGIVPAPQVVAGVVTNSATTPWPGTPIEGAIVEIVGGASTTTDAAGVYYLLLPPGTCTIRVSKTDYQTQQFQVTVGSEWARRDLELSLLDGVIQGVVRSGSNAPRPNEPLVGATVEIAAGGFGTTVAGDNGSYYLAVPPGNYTVRASMPGYRSQDALLSVTAGGNVVQNYTLDADYSAWDALRDFSGDRNPNGAWSYGRLDEETDVFTLLPSKVTWLADVAPSAVEGWDRGGNSLAGSTGYPHFVRNTTGADFVITKYNELMEAARLHSGPWSYPMQGALKWTAPVAGDYTVSATFKTWKAAASVGAFVRSSSFSIDWLGIVNGESGYQTMSQTAALAAGEAVFFSVNDGYDGPLSDSVSITATVQMSLGGNALMMGTVHSSASSPWPGVPIEGATVEVVGGAASTTTAADGTYHLVLAAGSYMIRVSKTGYADTTFSVNLAAGEAAAGNDAELLLSSGAITGVVTGAASGGPVEGATVEAVGSGVPPTTTQADGSYILFVPGGSYAVEADKFGYLPQRFSVSVAAGNTVTQDFVLDTDPTEIELFQYDLWDLKSWGGRSNGYQGPVMNQFTQGGYDGNSVSGAFVELQSASWAEVFCWPGQTGTGAGGYVRKAYQEPSYDQAGGGYTGWRQENELRQIEASNALAGEQWLVHRWTAPVPGTATVHMGAYGRNNWNLSGVNAVIAKNRVAIKSGWFEGFDGSPMMSKDVRANGGNAVDCHLVYDDTISVAAGDVLDIATNGDGRSFYPDATIEFTVSLVPSPQVLAGIVSSSITTPWPLTPIEGATVEILGGASTTTDAAGIYYLLLPPGTSTIRVSKTDYQTQQFQVTVGSEWIRRNVELSLTQGILGGAVTSSALAPRPGEPLVEATVELVGETVSTKTGNYGSYSLLVEPGQHTLRVTMPGYLPKESAATIAAGDRLTVDLVLDPDPNAWDATRDFSAARNPNGTWSYGYKQLGLFQLMSSNVTWAGNVPNGSVEGWDYGGNSLALAEGYPCWVRNTTGAEMLLDWGMILHAGRLFTHALSTYGTTPARFGVLQWTAPSAGTYSIYASFKAAQPATAEVAVYSSSGSVDWTAPLVGLGTEVTVAAENVQLAAGETISFELNDGGDGDSWADNAGIMATIVGADTATEVTTIADAKALADGTAVKITSAKVVTVDSASFIDGSYYLEEPDRSSGIKIVPQGGLPAVALGDRITLTGTVNTDANGERYINASSIDSQVSGAAVDPVGAVNADIASSSGLGMQGLLVTAWGKVTFTAVDGSYVYIDDGSILQDGSGNTGLRIVLGGLTTPVTAVPSVGQYYVITGACGLADGGIPTVRPRGDGDLALK